MDLINQIGISYKAGYLLQGNQVERSKTSTKLRTFNTEFKFRSDGKDFDIVNILKEYKGNVIVNLPAINPDLGNLKKIDLKVKELVNKEIKKVTIKASNITVNQFEWSTLDEQKKFFLNIVTGIATLAANRIEVCIENTHTNSENGFFGGTITEVSDIIIYSKKFLIKEFKFTEEDANKYIGLCLNVDNIIENNSIVDVQKWFKVFNKNIKCIKINDDDKNFDEKINIVINDCIDTEYDGVILLETEKELEDVEKEYRIFENKIKSILRSKNIPVSDSKIKEVTDAGYTNIIVISMIVATIFIALLMVLVKIRN